MKSNGFSMNPADLIAEIEDELASLDRLIKDIDRVYRERPKDPEAKAVYDESIALKLHNFYTGCERIFKRVHDDLDGKVSSRASDLTDWHKRLLKRMSLEIEGVRPNVISKETFKALEDFLAFRHLVRNIYGYELEEERLDILVEKAGTAYTFFKKDIKAFVSFLKKAGSLPA